MKKFLALVLAALMVLSMIACGGSTAPATSSNSGNTASSSTSSSSEKTDSNAAPAEESKSYQLIGVYDERGGQGASMMTAVFMLNLNADGTAVCDRYRYLSYDKSDFASNEGYDVNFMTGTWKPVTKDGVDCLQIKIAVVNDDGTTSNDQTAYAYEIAGEYSFDLTFPIVKGMSYSRVAPMAGGETKQYADGNALIAAYAEDPEMPEGIVVFKDEAINASLYFIADGTVELYAGYDKVADGKWSAEGVTLGGEAVELQVSENKSALIEYSRDRGDGVMTDYKLSCDDISPLYDAAGAEPEAPAADAPYTGDPIDLGGNPYDATLELHEDGTAVLKVAMGMAVKYERLGNIVILFQDENAPLEGYGATIFGIVPHAWEVNDEAKTMTGLKVAYFWPGEAAQMTFASADGEP